MGPEKSGAYWEGKKKRHERGWEYKGSKGNVNFQ